MPVAVCGEMAADPVLLTLLVGLGLREFSMAPIAIPLAKQVLRSLRVEDAQAIARSSLRAHTAADVEKVAARGQSPFCEIGQSGKKVTVPFLQIGETKVADVTRVDKPWGYELHWAKTDRYVGKLIHVNAGHALSLQYHNQKDETIFLWSGRMLFEIKEGDELVKREMKPGESVHVTPKTVHRMTAIEDCDIFEVSTPELHDVVRLEDRYGRVT